MPSQPPIPDRELQTNFELAVRLTAFDDADDIIELHNKIIADREDRLYTALEAAIGEDEEEQYGQYGDTDPTIRNVLRGEFRIALNKVLNRNGAQ